MSVPVMVLFLYENKSRFQFQKSDLILAQFFLIETNGPPILPCHNNELDAKQLVGTQFKVNLDSKFFNVWWVYCQGLSLESQL
jgi:hypothetical protein